MMTYQETIDWMQRVKDRYAQKENAMSNQCYTLRRYGMSFGFKCDDIESLIAELQQAKAEYDRTREPYYARQQFTTKKEWSVLHYPNYELTCQCPHEADATHIAALLNKAHNEGEAA